MAEPPNYNDKGGIGGRDVAQLVQRLETELGKQSSKCYLEERRIVYIIALLVVFRKS